MIRGAVVKRCSILSFISRLFSTRVGSGDGCSPAGRSSKRAAGSEGVAALLGLALFFSAGVQAERLQAQDGPDVQRQAQLTYLLKHDCGSCHGMTMKGGLGPSLQAQELSAKGHNVDSLSLIIARGIPDTAMPPWGPILEPEAIRWLARQLLEAQQP